MDPKKILIVGSAYPFRGGLAEFHERMAKAFQEAGHQVLIYTFTLQYPGFLFPGKTQFSPDPKPENLHIERKVHSLNPLNWRKVGREIREMGPDLLIVPFWLPFMGPCLGSILRSAAQNKKIRRVALVHNLIPHEGRPGDRPLSAYFLKQNESFIALSSTVKKELEEWPVHKEVKFVAHPIYDTFGEPVDKLLARNRLGLDTDKTVFLFFGFVRKYKGLDLLIKALADPRVKEKAFQLLIAGEFYEDKQAYLEMIKEAGLENKIIIRDEYIPREDVANYFCAADLVTQTYRSATQSGISQMAYHFNKPVLVTDVGGLSEIIADGKSGYVVKPNPNSIAEGLFDFLNKGEAFFKEGIKSQKNKFSWQSLVDAFLEISNLSA